MPVGLGIDAGGTATRWLLLEDDRKYHWAYLYS
jgi:N-acetylglucosamine kinase-like BadF-type ATPase